jgi:hypothetical protein
MTLSRTVGSWLVSITYGSGRGYKEKWGKGSKNGKAVLQSDNKLIPKGILSIKKSSCFIVVGVSMYV